MNRKTIDKAAWDYADSINMIYGSKENIIEDFKAGAEWRINSVWHESSEIPESGKYVLILNGGAHGCSILWMNADPTNWDEYVKNNKITAWAYINDLIPDRKEARP